MRSLPRSRNEEAHDVAAEALFDALAWELADMAACGRSLELVVARLAARAVEEDGVVESLQTMDKLMQRLDVLGRFLGDLKRAQGGVPGVVVEDALDGVTLDDLRRRLRRALTGLESGDEVARSGDFDLF